MLRYLPAVILAGSTLLADIAPAIAQTTPSPPSARPALPIACGDLASQWDGIEKDLAYTAAIGQGDTTGAHEASRSHHELANLTTANLLYAMMRDNKCPLPKAPPSARAYKSAALACVLESNEKSQRKACDRKSWARDAH